MTGASSTKPETAPNRALNDDNTPQDVNGGSSAILSTSTACEPQQGWRRRQFAAIGWGYSAIMILVFTLSSIWSALLITLNVAPQASANFILQTASLDNGHFWKFRVVDVGITSVSSLLLVVTIAVYWYLLYLLLGQTPTRRVHSEATSRKPKREIPPALQRVASASRMMLQPRVVQHRPLRVVGKALRAIVGLYRNVIVADGKYRKIWNVVLEIPEVVLQALSLREHMLQGLDASLLYLCAALMAINAFLVSYHMLFQWKQHAMHHILKDAVVDAIFAVFFPALVLLHSITAFHEDLLIVKIRQQFFPPRAFERKARNFVDPRELNMFATGFESLLIQSGWDIILKLSFNVLSCIRWWKILLLLLQKRQLDCSHPHQATPASFSNQEMKKTGPATFPSVNYTAVMPVGPTGEVFRAEHSVVSWIHPRRVIRRSVGLLFLLYGLVCVVYTAIAVHLSTAACSPYTECVQFAHTWAPGMPHKWCECLAFVDRDLSPDDSIELLDATQSLSVLAAAGRLQTVQIVNRRLNGTFPDELQRCQSLRNLVLIYTGIETFPAWTSTTFTNLEYLHIEGDDTDTNLVELPHDLFASMASLHTMHLSHHANLPALPSLNGLSTLESVYFGYLECLQELPVMTELPRIQVIVFEGFPQIRTLPDVTPFQETLQLLVVQDMAVCCSGFLDAGDCNTAFPTCCEPDNTLEGASASNGNSSSRLPPSCLRLPKDLDLLPTTATLELLSQYAVDMSNFCDATQATCPDAIVMSGSKDYKNECAGVLYRECSTEASGVGICFNPDMHRVQCVFSQATVNMRKAEIAAGSSCDKEEEQWLGCT